MLCRLEQGVHTLYMKQSGEVQKTLTALCMASVGAGYHSPELQSEGGRVQAYSAARQQVVPEFFSLLNLLHLWLPMGHGDLIVNGAPSADWFKLSCQLDMGVQCFGGFFPPEVICSMLPYNVCYLFAIFLVFLWMEVLESMLEVRGSEFHRKVYLIFLLR